MVRLSRSERVIQQRIKALARHLPAARAGDEVALHQARVATRRIRESLPVIAADRPGRLRKAERLIRRLTEALGPVRELDVTLALLDEFQRARIADRESLGRVRSLMRDERQRVHAALVERIDDTDVAKLERRLLALAHAADGAESKKKAEPEARARALRRAGRRAVRLQAAMEQAAGLYLPDRLHHVRIAVKKQRYALEVLRELIGSRATADIRVLKQVQNWLGRMHDLEVLIMRTRAVQSAPKAPDLRVSAELDGLVRHLETECRQLHGHYIAARRKVAAVCAAAIAAAAPRPRGRSAA